MNESYREHISPSCSFPVFLPLLSPSPAGSPKLLAIVIFPFPVSQETDLLMPLCYDDSEFDQVGQILTLLSPMVTCYCPGKYKAATPVTNVFMYYYMCHEGFLPEVWYFGTYYNVQYSIYSSVL